MANQGLANYEAYKSFSLSNGVNVHVNLCNENKNVNIVVPIWDELKKFGLDFSFVQNHQSSNNIGYYGYGCSLMMLMQKLSLENDCLRLKRGDGLIISLDKVDSTENYNDYYSKKEKIYARIINTEPNYFTVSDLHGNYWDYRSSYYMLPSLVNYNHYTYTSAYENNKVVFTREDGLEKVELTIQTLSQDNSICTKIEYYVKDSSSVFQLNRKYTFTYENNYCKKITDIFDNKTVNNHELLLSAGISYQIQDSIKNETIKCEFSNGNIVVSQFHNDINTAIVHNINYDIEKTTITNSFGENLTYVFENNLVKYIFDEKYNSNIFTFDENCNMISKQTNLAFDDEKKTILGEDLSDYTVTNSVTTSTDYPNLTITKVFYMSANAKIEQQKNFISYVRESLCLSFLVKSIDSGKIKATLKINNSKTKTITVEAKSFYHPVSINLFFDGVIERAYVSLEVLSGNCYVAGIKLAPISNEFGIQYNNQGLVVGKNNGAYSSKLCYDENSYLLSKSGNDFSGSTQTYKGKDLVYERTNGVEKKYSYSNEHDLSKEIITFEFGNNEGESCTETFEENYTYSNHYPTSALDHNNVSYQYANDIVKKRLKKMVVNGITTTYNYDGLNDLGPTFEGSSLTKDNLITYNSKNQIIRYNHVTEDSIVNQYQFNYNDDLELNSIEENDLEYGIIDYENETSDTLPHTGRVKVVRYGCERGEYTYDGRGNITRKNINYSTIYDYSYNYLDQLKEVKRGDDVIEEFDYDIRNQLVSHQINNGISHTFSYKPACTKFSNSLCSERYQLFGTQGRKTKDGIYEYYYRLGYASFFDFKETNAQNYNVTNSKALINKTYKVFKCNPTFWDADIEEGESIPFNCLRLNVYDLSYNLGTFDDTNIINVHFWCRFKNLLNNVTVASFRMDNLIYEIKVYKYTDDFGDNYYKLALYHEDTEQLVLDSKLITDDWNLISFSMDRLLYDRVGIGLNIEYKRVDYGVCTFPAFNKFVFSISSTYVSKVTGILFTKGTNCANERNTFYDLVRELKEAPDNQTSGIMLYNSNVEYYPLLNSYNSLNDDKPRTYSSTDFASDFVFDNELRRNVYFSHGQHILYCMNGFSFSVSVKFKILEFFDYNPILSMPSSSTLNIGCNKNGKIMLNNSLINMTIDGNWHTLKYTYIVGTGAKLQIDDLVYTFSGSTMYGTINLRLGYESEDKYSIAKFCDLVYKSGSEIADSDYNAYGVINTYDPLGRLQSFKKFDSNVNLVYNEYNKDLVSKVSVKNNQNTYDEYNYEYQFINGNPVVNKIIYQEETKNEFVYDEFGRLIKEIRGNVEDNYSYDIRGNIVNNKGVTYYYEGSFMDRLTKVGNDTVSYDVIGNISSYKGVNYSYLGKKLTSVTSDDINITFVYNDANQRIKKINNSTGETTYYVYENDLLKFEYTGNNWISYLYLDGRVIGFRKNGGSPYYYIYDGIGNIVSIMNSNNERVVDYEYDAFGNVLSITGSESSSLGVPNHFRYKGYYYDTETNLYFLKTRYYSPELCRFISPDSVDYLDPDSINGLNLYAYCGNDPVNRCDPDGHSFILAMLIGAGIGAIIGLGSQLTSDVISNLMVNNIDFSKWEMSSWQTYVGAGLGGAIGGALTPFLGPVSTAFITGFSSTGISMGLSNVTRESNYSIIEVILTSLLIGSISGITTGIIDKIKIPKINSGRGSLTAISKQINTKLVKNQIKRVSFKTLSKMALLNAIYSLPFTVFNGTFTNGLVLSPAY